ncbi:FtsX-like permease family protein [Streptomyces tritici]|uniref:FtsX-like permease family protein n=1 Tax=Streptomyces tritici TaxID=2054410 RepID=UPI003AF1A51C
MTGFVLLRVRAHRLLLAAALLAVLLTTSVLAALAGFSGSVGDAALRSVLQGREAGASALVVTAQVPAERRASADAAVRAGARTAFDGLPVTVRRLERSGPYALPRALQAPAARGDQPDLTRLATLDRSRITLVRGTLPRASGAGPVEVALPEAAARRLRLGPGAVLDLTDRLDQKSVVTAKVTGVYRPADLTDTYWLLDEAAGRGVRTMVFTTYGPLLADEAHFAAGRFSRGDTAWQATADFAGMTTGRIDALRGTAAAGAAALTDGTEPFGGGQVTAETALPTVLQQIERPLLVARSTVLIVAVQLVLLAAYALLLVARLLSSERSGETELLRARGGSRGRITWLAAVEAGLLALPAAVVAPLLAGPLTRLLGSQAALADAGLRLDATPAAQVWLVAAGVAVCCAAAVVAPALAAGGGGTIRLRKGRAAALPAWVRAGADLGLLVVAAVAYWQLQRQTDGSGGGALSGDREGRLGIDPLLVAAPALALLAGTVLTLRLLPPAARLAERRAAGGRGLPAALAGWQFSRRPLRGAGPVLLLVLAVAMGMLAIGQSASWSRSQSDQADFRTGASVRVLTTRGSDPAEAGRYSGMPGVRAAAPALRDTMPGLGGGRTADVIALDVAGAAAGDGLLMRGDLAGDRPVREVLGALAPPGRDTGPAGVRLPDDTRSLTLDLRLTSTARHATAPRVSVTLEDRYGIPYGRVLGSLPADGRTHRLTADLAGEADPGSGRPAAPAAPLTLTGLQLDGDVEYGKPGTERLVVERLAAAGASGAARPVPGTPARWTAELREGSPDGGEGRPRAVRRTAGATAPVDLAYRLGTAAPPSPWTVFQSYGLRLTSAVESKAEPLPAVASDAFLSAAGAGRGDTMDVTLGGRTLTVRIAETVRQLPTTGANAAKAAGAGDGGGILFDLRAANRLLAPGDGPALQPNEWWLATAPGRADEVAATLRALPNTDPAQVLVRDETAAELLGDPLGAGPRSALMAVAAAAAALAAVGFAVSAAGSVRERAGEFGLLRALGAPRRQLARLIAAEQGLLVALGLLVGLALGTVLTRAVVPLVLLTPQAARPVPPVLVELPPGQVAVLLAAVAAVPVLIVAAIALRREDPATTLRTQGAE